MHINFFFLIKILDYRFTSLSLKRVHSNNTVMLSIPVKYYSISAKQLAHKLVIT